MSDPPTLLWVETWGKLTGGGHRSLLDIVSHLDQTRFRPVVVCGSEGSLVAMLNHRGIHTHVVDLPPLRSSRLRRQAAIRRLRALIEDARGRLVHANSVRAALYSLRAAAPLKIPVVFHARVLRASWLREWWVDQYLAWRCRLILANSHTVARRFRWCLRRAAVKVLYNGIDSDAFARADGRAFRAQVGLPEQALVVGIAGMLEPRKGHLVLFEAFQHVLAKVPEAYLLVAGCEPPDRAGYQAVLKAAVAARSVDTHVRFLGFVEDIPAFMAALDVCVLPVVQPEGFGRTLIEAAAAGRPVVASRLGAVPEIVEEGRTGLLVPAADARALAEALVRLLADSALRHQLGQQARQRARERFSLETMMTQLTTHYQALLRSP